MAIITQTLKTETIKLIKDNFDSSANNYFIGIGRSDEWNSTDTAPTAENSAVEGRLFRNALQSVKKVADMTFVVPRHNWSSGTIYSPYNDKQVGYPAQSYYVMNDENQVYICIQQSKDSSGNAQTSTVKPSGELNGTTFVTSDGYAWKFLYSISASSASKFVAANFLPVKKQGATDGSSPASDVEQLAVQNAAIAGQIVGYAVDSGGLGYGSAPTLSVVGDGGGAKAIATISGGAVVKVEVHDSAGGFPLGSGYTNASIDQSGGSPTLPAKIRPIIGSKGGLGADPREDLRSDGVMFAVKPDGAEGSGDFIVGNDFRQVGLLRNITGDSDNGTLFTDATGNCLKKLVLTSKVSSFSVDETVSGGTSGAKGIVDKISTNGLELFFHQNDETGYKTFGNAETVTGGTSGATGATHGSAPVVSPEVATITGDLLYIDNRAAVTRSADQTEDIKIVIQL